MSVLYRVIERAALGLDHVSGGRLKQSIGQSLTHATGKEALPAWVYRKVHVEELSQDGLPIYVLTPPGANSSAAVLFCHGGGGMSRPTRLHYDTVVRLVRQSGAAVYLPFYPLAPEHNVRDALGWLEALYVQMLEAYPADAITFAGDSAGANLCLSLTERVTPRPRQIIAISPAFGIEDGESREIRLQMESQDPLLTVAMNDRIKENWGRGVALNSADISPEYIDYTGFPEITVFYGSHELFYPLVERGIERMRAQGVCVHTVLEPMCHDWAICSFLPEGRAAIRRMGKMITAL